MGVVVRMPRKTPDRVAHRLVVLLKELSPVERRAEMGDACRRLWEADLWEGRTSEDPTPEEFAQAVILNNPLMQENWKMLRNELVPTSWETVGELVSNLLPANGSLD